MTDKELFDHIDRGNEEILKQWFAELQKHAREFYNVNGWDFFVECWDFATFKQFIEEEQTDPVLTYNDALIEVSKMMKILADHRKDIQGTAW